MSLQDKTAFLSLQEALGYQFSNLNILRTALCHVSISQEASNQRLEFLGDRVLGLVIAHTLYEASNEAEGMMARRLNDLVSRQCCALVARRLNLGALLEISNSEALTGGRDKETVLADACEALIAAIFLDSDWQTVKQVVTTLWKPLWGEQQKTPPPIDAKSALQEWVQKRAMPLPDYRLIATDGKAHDPLFTVQVTLSDGQQQQAQAGSKRKAEQKAAKLMLQMIDIETNNGSR